MNLNEIQSTSLALSALVGQMQQAVEVIDALIDQSDELIRRQLEITDNCLLMHQQLSEIQHRRSHA